LFLLVQVLLLVVLLDKYLGSLDGVLRLAEAVVLGAKTGEDGDERDGERWDEKLFRREVVRLDDALTDFVG
jgi:predicted phosphohydrolase